MLSTHYGSSSQANDKTSSNEAKLLEETEQIKTAGVACVPHP
jgi:hypothetical protein